MKSNRCFADVVVDRKAAGCGDSEARLRTQQQRTRMKQQREAERAQQEREQHAKMSKEAEREREDSTLARSASTESGFHTHTDRAEGDDIPVMMSLEPEAQRESEDDANSYSLPLRPEAEEYAESAEAEQQHLHSHPNYALQFLMLLDAGLEAYSEPYDTYSLSEHVYEEICDAPTSQAAAGLQLLQSGAGKGDYHQQEAVGSRLRHYDERSDGESDSPEKEAEFAPYPRVDSCDQEDDADSSVNGAKKGSQSFDPAAKDPTDKEEKRQADKLSHKSNKTASRGKSAKQQAETSVKEPVRNSVEKRDAISLAIKDIKEAIEEVKNRTVRSPYTPDEPKEPIWVMRQDLSPTAECDLPTSLGADLFLSEGKSLMYSLYAFLCVSCSESELCVTPVPGPCDPDDLIDGIIFAANYLGSTQLLSDKTPSKNIRMMQAQEAVSRVKMAQKLAQNKKKEPEGEPQPLTEVDLFISTQRIKVLNADSQETMMDHPLRTISYIADIGSIVVLMARRRMPRTDSEENVETSEPSQDSKRQYKMICHVFESEDAQLIAQSIGQAFSVAYQEFLRANGINPEDLSQKEYSDLLNTQDMYNDDLVHFSKSENCKNVFVEKAKGEILGVVIVESGWGSILPTGLKNQSHIKLNIVRCPPVTTVLIRRPDLRYQLGFSVQNGIICSLMRGGIAERGGVRVGHRIIEINSQSVVATPHEKIVHILSSAVGEIHMKTMPAAMYRLLTAQEQPVYI
uniref:Amyloid beta (A4) precursor protein-binding, family A, member 1a n=1 Tax=Neolamprologus brichardi TaxID=32507 RepID=A0A3Q4GP31_NEOBR